MDIKPDILEKLVAGLSKLKAGELANLRLKVTRQAVGRPDLAALKEAIDEHLMAGMEIPGDGWTAGAQGLPRFRMKAGQKLAVVYRIDTHGQHKGEYGIEVFGETLNEFPRGVDEARAIANSRLDAKVGWEAV